MASTHTTYIDVVKFYKGSYFPISAILAQQFADLLAANTAQFSSSVYGNLITSLTKIQANYFSEAIDIFGNDPTAEERIRTYTEILTKDDIKALMKDMAYALNASGILTEQNVGQVSGVDGDCITLAVTRMGDKTVAPAVAIWAAPYTVPGYSITYGGTTIKEGDGPTSITLQTQGHVMSGDIKIDIAETGGGNPNYVETIEGTLANPWGDSNIDVGALATAVNTGNATAKMVIDASTLDLSPVIISSQIAYRGGDDTNLYFGGVDLQLAIDQSRAVAVTYSSDGSLYVVYLLMNGTSTDMRSYASAFPTTLTIIHHPLPDSGS